MQPYIKTVQTYQLSYKLFGFNSINSTFLTVAPIRTSKNNFGYAVLIQEKVFTVRYTYLSHKTFSKNWHNFITLTFLLYILFNLILAWISFTNEFWYHSSWIPISKVLEISPLSFFAHFTHSQQKALYPQWRVRTKDPGL